MSSTTNRAEIEVLLQELARAHVDHDADVIVEAYASDAVIFDLAPPLRRRGMNRASVAAWLSGWDGPIQIMRAMSILRSTLTWPSYQHSTECAGALAVKIRICGTAQRCAFGE